MGLSIRLKIPRIEEVQKSVGQRRRLVEAALLGGLEDGVNLTFRAALLKLSGPVLKVDTGRLRESMQMRVEKGTNPRGVIGTNVVYGRIHELGGKTRPHVILPKKAKALRFLDRLSGQIVFRKRVSHPGSVMPARPYLGPSLEESIPKIQKIMLRRLSAALAGRPQ